MYGSPRWIIALRSSPFNAPRRVARPIMSYGRDLYFSFAFFVVELFSSFTHSLFLSQRFLTHFILEYLFSLTSLNHFLTRFPHSLTLSPQRWSTRVRARQTARSTARSELRRERDGHSCARARRHQVPVLAGQGPQVRLPGRHLPALTGLKTRSFNVFTGLRPCSLNVFTLLIIFE